MVSKKVIGGIIAVVAVISIIALIPVFMYGFGVTVVELNTGYGLSTSSTSESGYELQQYTGDYSALQAQQQQVDPYTYFFGKFNQHTSVSQQGGTSIPVNVDVNIHIELDILTPAGSINRTIDITNQQGISNGGINVIVGPDDGAIVNGTYHVWFTLNVSISIEGFGELNIDHTFHTTVDVIIQG